MPKSVRIPKPPKPSGNWYDPTAGPVAVLAVDAASVTVGYGAMSETMRPVAFGVLKGGSGDEDTRALRLVDSVLVVAQQLKPAVVAVEITKGIRYGLKSRSTDLATLARVQGRIVQSLIDSGHRVVSVLDTTWTAGRSKVARASHLCMVCPEYAAWVESGKDVGRDAADALELALYWIGKQASLDLMARAEKGGRS